MSKDTNRRVSRILDNAFLGRFGKLGSTYTPNVNAPGRTAGVRSRKPAGPKAK